MSRDCRSRHRWRHEPSKPRYAFSRRSRRDENCRKGTISDRDRVTTGPSAPFPRPAAARGGPRRNPGNPQIVLGKVHEPVPLIRQKVLGKGRAQRGQPRLDILHAGIVFTLQRGPGIGRTPGGSASERGPVPSLRPRGHRASPQVGDALKQRLVRRNIRSNAPPAWERIRAAALLAPGLLSAPATVKKTDSTLSNCFAAASSASIVLAKLGALGVRQSRRSERYALASPVPAPGARNHRRKSCAKGAISNGVVQSDRIGLVIRGESPLSMNLVTGRAIHKRRGYRQIKFINLYFCTVAANRAIRRACVMRDLATFPIIVRRRSTTRHFNGCTSTGYQLRSSLQRPSSRPKHPASGPNTPASAQDLARDRVPGPLGKTH